METSQIEQRFNAAVNVIRGLPKNGLYTIFRITIFTTFKNSIMVIVNLLVY